MSDDDPDDGETTLCVHELVRAALLSPPHAPVVIIDSERGVPIPYRIGVGWASGTDGTEMPVFAILVGDHVAEAAEEGAIMFGSLGPLDPDDSGS